MERLVTLEEMLCARDARQARLNAALDRIPLISFTMNIAGPVKTSPLLRRAFSEGCRRLEKAFAQRGIALHRLEMIDAATGSEALYSAGCDGLQAKALCASCEDADELGRLFDMDVIAAQGRRIARAQVGLAERGCMICGAEGRGCAARRAHSVEQLRAETTRRVEEYFKKTDRERAGTLAAQCLVDEVRVTPKPGLVDRSNSGSHSDMDLALFEKSAAALAPFWDTCIAIGMESADKAPEETFARLRCAGLSAEETMLRATQGINTHKGAIFLLGTLCGAVGRLWRAEQPCRDARALCAECARMSAAALGGELAQMTRADTAGAQIYLRHGLRGARGELMDGLPGVWNTVLPVMEDAIARGCGEEHAAAIALVHLIARETDTNMIKRGGLEGAAWGAERARELIGNEAVPTAQEITALDREFIARGLSPGGCADLLALGLFLRAWAKEDENN